MARVRSARALSGVFGEMLDDVLLVVRKHSDSAARAGTRRADDAASAAARHGDDVARASRNADRLANPRPRGSGNGSVGRSGRRPPHSADAHVVRNGEVVSTTQHRSGGMTPEESALNWPRSSLATHTENRIMRDPFNSSGPNQGVPPLGSRGQLPDGLQRGDTVVIDGQYPPCGSCKGRMNDLVEQGANVIYRHGDETWVAGRRNTPITLPN